VTFLRRLLGGRQGEPEPADDRAWYDVPSGSQFDIAGTHYHVDELVRIFPDAGDEPITTDAVAELVREPNNPHDPNAVAVLIQRRLVGYIPAELAPAWSRYLAALETRGLRARAAAAVWRHWNRREYERPLFYVGLAAREEADYPMPEEIAAQEAEHERLALEKAEARAARAANREHRARERADREAQRLAWRAKGLCESCGSVIEQRVGRGRPPVRCSACRAR
jgi:RNA polymerase-binding transcription factor DksA